MSIMRTKLLLALILTFVLSSIACQKKQLESSLNDLVAPSQAGPASTPKVQEMALGHAKASARHMKADVVSRDPTSSKSEILVSPPPAAEQAARLVPELSSASAVRAPLGQEPRKHAPSLVEANMALPAAALPEGDVDPGITESQAPSEPLADGTPVPGLTVVVSELPRDEEASQEVIHRVRPKKEHVTLTPVPGADTNIDLQDCSDPNTPPSTLQGGGDTKANVGNGNYNVSQTDWSAATTDGVPFDVDMAVGPTHIVTDVNTRFRVYDKSGASLAGPTTYQSFWSGLTKCGAAQTATDFLADPQIVYDDENDRWVMATLRAQVTSAGVPITSQLCLACSKTGDPTGAWWKYELTDGAGLADYPHLGIGEDAIFLGVNHFAAATGSYDNAVVWAINKTSAYGGTATTRRLTAGTTIFTPQPAERRGYAQGHYPPTGTPHYFVALNRSTAAVDIWRFTQPSLTAGTFTTWGTLQSDGGAPPVMTGTNITNSAIDGGDQRPMDCELRWPYLWYTRGAIATQGSIQWAGTNVSGASPALYQSGEYSDSNRSFHWPDATVDRNQDFVIGFTGENNATTSFPGAYITGRENSVTANNTLEAYVVAKDGEVKYNTWEPTTDPWRWGDYAGVAIDPNGCDIWFAGQYTSNTGAGNPLTKTWIRNYKFASCVAGASHQAYLDRSLLTCYETVIGSIVDTGGTPTNPVYHATNGNILPAAITSSSNPYAVSPVTVAQLGASNGDSVWLSFTGSDAASYNSSSATVKCATNVCVASVDTPKGGCDNDSYLDRSETMNLFVNFVNNETTALPTGFLADLRVDPSFPDANMVIVNGTAEYPALDVGATSAPVGRPFQVRCTGGTDIRTVHFEVYNIRALDDSWTGGSGCGAGALKFTEIANANDQLGTAYTGFPESFDGATFPPSNWSQVDVVGTALNWARFTATAHPTGGSPHTGTGMAGGNNYSDGAVGDQVRLQRILDVSTTANANVAVSLWMFHDTGYSTYGDYIQVQASTNAGSTWTSVGPKLLRTEGGNKVWLNHIIDASSVAGGKATVRIGLLDGNEYGNDVYVDDVSFAPVTKVADTNVCSGAPILALSSTYQGPGEGYLLYDTQCNANGYPDAGDTGTMLFYLSNTGNEPAYGVTATLSCPTCPAGVTICKDTATYGDIPYGSGYVYAQPDNGFQVAIPAALASGTALPWVLTVNATNPYTTTINVPTDNYFKSRSGTPTYISNGDPYGYSIADYFTTAPGTDGAPGRYGFSTKWTATSGVTKVASATDPLGLGYCAQLTGKLSTSPQTMEHTFSTVGIDTDVSFYWLFNYGKAPTTSLFFFEWDNNDGNGWRNFIPGGTGQAGAGGNTDAWVQYGYFSLFSRIYNTNPVTYPGYGPAAAVACLNNANFKVRFRCTWTGSSNSSWQISPFWMDEVHYVNVATPCAGSCLGPEAPTVAEVRDVDPCALSGVRVFFDKGINTASAALYKDAVSAVPSYTSGDVYAPGDSSSHNYTIRATNTTGSTDSNPAVAGVDASSTGTPTFACTPGTCSDPTSVLLTTQSGFSNYQWYKDAGAIGGATSNTYTATTSGTYTVAYKIGACTDLSAGTAVTIGSANPPAVPNGGDVPGTPFKMVKNGSNVDVTWDSTCTGSTDYRILWGDLSTLSLVSGVTNGTVSSATCALGTTGSKTNQTSPTDFSTVKCYFAVIDSVTGTSFGRHGNNSSANERVLSGDTTFCGATAKNTTATTCN